MTKSANPTNSKKLKKKEKEKSKKRSKTKAQININIKKDQLTMELTVKLTVYELVESEENYKLTN